MTGSYTPMDTQSGYRKKASDLQFAAVFLSFSFYSMSFYIFLLAGFKQAKQEDKRNDAHNP